MFETDMAEKPIETAGAGQLTLFWPADFTAFLHYMKNTIEAEDLREMNFAPFSESIAITSVGSLEPNALMYLSTEPELTFLDKLLSSIKWSFLFIPGTLAMHCWVMMLSFFMLGEGWPEGVLVGSLGAMMIYSFMILFGLGRLSDLRYWRVIAAILSSSILISVIYHIVSIFIGYEYFGWGMLLTAPLTIAFAQYMKVRIDKGEQV